jgi:hypothetical protein
MSKVYLGKSETWEDYRCNRINKLPDNFFNTPPFIHESGFSYAYLAFLLAREPFFNHEWIKSNLNLFHVYELEELPIKSMDGNFQALSTLKKVDLESLIKGSPFIITDEKILVRNRQEPNVGYKIYPRIEFESFLKEKLYFIKPFLEGEQCYYREGRFCLEKSTGSIAHIFMQSSIIIFSGSIIILLLIGIILFRKIRLQKLEDERKKHALRVLTHELRTPITNLLLQVEQINMQSDQIPNDLMEEFLTIESEVYRLKRLAEKSTSYLQTYDGRSLLALNPQMVVSLNELVRDMIDNYTMRGVKFIPAVNDQEFTLDVYWFSICIKNLIENALLHGKSPVTVELIVDADSLTLRVVDYGDSNYKTLDEILSSDRTGKNSMGLGVGLSMVKKIIKEMNGSITYASSPTTFSLFLRNIK